jgi:hypothetical protein
MSGSTGSCHVPPSTVGVSLAFGTLCSSQGAVVTVRRGSAPGGGRLPAVTPRFAWRLARRSYERYHLGEGLANLRAGIRKSLRRSEQDHWPPSGRETVPRFLVHVNLSCGAAAWRRVTGRVQSTGPLAGRPRRGTRCWTPAEGGPAGAFEGASPPATSQESRATKRRRTSAWRTRPEGPFCSPSCGTVAGQCMAREPPVPRCAERAGAGLVSAGVTARGDRR